MSETNQEARASLIEHVARGLRHAGIFHGFCRCGYPKRKPGMLCGVCAAPPDQVYVGAQKGWDFP